MTRRAYIEQLLREVYGGQPPNDASITPGLVNQLINQGIGAAAKTAYVDSIKLDGIAYISDAFHTTFKNLVITKEDAFLYKMTLPEYPLGVGRGDSVGPLVLRDADGKVSDPLVPINQSQRVYHKRLRAVPNRTLYYFEGNAIYVITTIPITSYTGQVTMVSGGDSTNLDSTLNVPSDYLDIVTAYVLERLGRHQAVPEDPANDGKDNK